MLIQPLQSVPKGKIMTNLRKILKKFFSERLFSSVKDPRQLAIFPEKERILMSVQKEKPPNLKYLCNYVD